ncbi:MAG: hypothetical protein IFNCLDLE_02694 [Ignavibacteriaceae bacterium]|nr:hypothetical protein [Ignavibacteriaceae bacterium]
MKGYMKFFTQTMFTLAGSPDPGSRNEWVEAESKEAAEKIILDKYASYGAEYGNVQVLVLTENEKLDMDDDAYYEEADVPEDDDDELDIIL